MRFVLAAALFFAGAASHAAAADIYISLDDGADRFEARAPQLAGDPDRPIIVGSVPNAPQNESSFEFIIERASSSVQKIMIAITDGNTYPKLEIGALRTDGGNIVTTLYDVRFVEARAGDLVVRPGRAASPAALRALSSDPVIRVAYQCAEWINRRSGDKSPPCPQAGKAAGEVTMKGAKINQN